MLVTIFGGIMIFNQVIGNRISYGIGIALGIAGILLLSKYQVQISAQKTLKTPANAELVDRKD